MLSLTCHFTNSSISSLLVLAKVDNNQRGMKRKPMALIKLLCNTIHDDVVKTAPSKEENIKLKDEIGDKNIVQDASSSSPPNAAIISPTDEDSEEERAP